MKNTTIIVGIILLLVVGAFFVFSNSGKESVNLQGNSGQDLQGVQKFVLTMKNSNYYPNEITVKADTPVSISLDNKVTGCLRSFNIKQLGLSKYMVSVSDALEFTPTQKGTYTFACSMGMGYGKLIVK